MWDSIGCLKAELLKIGFEGWMAGGDIE